MDNKIVYEFLKRKFKKETNVLLFGSYAKSIDFSDIDILILTDRNIDFSKELYTFKKHLFEVFTISKNNFFEIVEKDKPFGIYISIILNGLILIDKDDFLLHIKNLIKKKEIKSSPILRKYYLENKVQELLNQLQKTYNIYEKEILLSELNLQLIDLKLMDYNIIEAKKVKLKYEKIKYHDNHFLINIINYKNEFLHTISYTEYLEKLNEFFPIYNLLDRNFYSNKYFLSEIYNNEIVVYLRTDNSNYIASKNLFLQTLWKNNINNFFFFKIQQGKILEQGIYLVIYYSNEKIKKDIIPILNKIFSSNVTFPYQLEISSMLGIFPRNQYQNCKAFFVEISKYINRNVIPNSKLPLLIINIYIGSYIYSGLSKEYFKKRFSLMLHKFEALIEHKNHNISLFQKEIYKKNTEEVFFTTANISKEIFEIYNNAIEKWDIDFLPEDGINEVLKTMDFNIIYTERTNVEYNFLNLILNIFLLDDYHKLYIFRTIAAILNKENEL